MSRVNILGWIFDHFYWQLSAIYKLLPFLSFLFIIFWGRSADTLPKPSTNKNKLTNKFFGGKYQNMLNIYFTFFSQFLKRILIWFLFKFSFIKNFFPVICFQPFSRFDNNENKKK